MILPRLSVLFNNKTVKQTILKDAFWYSSSEIISRFLKIFLFIFIARILGAEDYGLFSFAISFTMLFSIISGFGLRPIVVREFAQKKPSKQEMGSLLSLKFILGLLSFIFIFISSFFIETVVARPLIIVFGAALLIDTVTYFFIDLFRARQKMEYLAIVQISKSVLITSVGLIVLFNYPNITFVSYAYLAGSSVAFFISAFIVARLSFFSFPIWNLSIIKKYLSFSWPLLLSTISVVIFTHVDSVMMGIWNMITEVGWYQAAYRIIDFAILPGAVLSSVFYPVLARTHKNDKSLFKKSNNILFEIFMFLFFPIVIGGFMLANKIIPFFYGEEFLPSVNAFKILIFSAGLVLLIIFLNSLLNSTGQQKAVFYISAFAAISNIILNFILIPRYSLYGAAWATVLSQLLMCFLGFLVLKKGNILPNLSAALIPLVAVMLMLAFLSITIISEFNVIIQIISAGLIYSLVFYLIKSKYESYCIR